MNQFKIVLHIYKTLFLFAFALIFSVCKKYDIVFKILQRCGPVLIKFFQWISNRKDIISPEIIKCLSRFQEENEEHGFHHTLDIVEKDKVNLIFFEDKPIASGSVAQVYKGLYNKKKVAIKVVHPNYDQEVITGIYVLDGLLTYMPILKNIKKCLDINDFYALIKKQRNFQHEVENIKTFRKNFLDINYKNINNKLKWSQLIDIPRVLYSNNDMIVESFCEGDNIYDYCKENPDETLNALSLLWYTYYGMILNHNFVHGDIHPGNLLFRLNNGKTQLVLLDFGIVNVMEPELHKKFKAIFKNSLFVPDIQAGVDFGIECNINKDFKEEELKANLSTYMELRREKSDTGMFGTLIAIMNKSNLLIKSGYMNIILGLILLENYVADLVGDQVKFRNYMYEYGIKNKIYDIETNEILL